MSFNIYDPFYTIESGRASTITLNWPSGRTDIITPFTNTINIRGISWIGQRPNSFEWVTVDHDYKISVAVLNQLIRWFEEEFYYAFNTDQFIWQMSCATLPEIILANLSESFLNRTK